MKPIALVLTAVMAALCVVSCGDKPIEVEPATSEPELARGVLHLDPRLQDGSSSAMELANHSTVIREWSFEGLSAMPDEWNLDSGQVNGSGANGGLNLAPLEGRKSSPTLRYTDAVDPLVVNSIEIELAISNSARSTVAWGRPRPLEAGFVASLCEGSSRRQTLRFSLDGSEAWARAIDKLILKMSSNRTQGFELLAIRFISEPLAWGQSPLDSTGKTSGDAGIIVLNGMGSRAWPARLGAPLSATVKVPVGGKLSVQVARPSNATNIDLRARIRVGLANDENTFIESGQSLSIGDSGWHALALGLDSFAGSEVVISFEVVAKDEGAPTDAIQADAFFGAPMILGTLPNDRRPNILLVTLDTLRFDALGSSKTAVAEGGETDLQQDRVDTEFLDALAAKSYVFDSAWSAGNSTQPSHASILTGVSIQDHSLVDNYGVLADGNITLAERLRASGYQTAAVTCQRAIGPDAGFGQGFDMFIPAEAVSGTDGRLSVDGAREWLQAWEREGERPFFLWVHVFDPHTPYELPGNYLATYSDRVGAAPERQATPPTLPLVNVIPPELAFLGEITSRDYVDYLYHAEVAYTDALMADLFGTLESTGAMANTLSFVTADHGEFLGERGNFYNHRGLFPETLHVPLLMTLPGQADGKHIASRVTNRDIVPTVLSQLGLGEVNAVRDLVGVAEEAVETGERRLWFEHANNLQIGCRDERYHFITTLREGYRFGLTQRGPGQPAVATPVPKGSSFLFDWKADPGLLNNLADERPEIVKEYLRAFAEYRASARPVGRVARDISTSEAADLEALGYTGD